ncbi:MAG: molybdopterin molybdenumtransferase MoeA [Lysobacteraceae bacterium]|nr:MAG: molybdopterin molybdenumtransferase MoeA [Xanthomonadaceae bacterium]
MGGFPTRIGYEEALAIVQRVSTARALDGDRMAIKRADSRILMQDVVAGIDLPPFDNSRMDGFALRHADLAADDQTPLRIVGDQFAGVALGIRLNPGECVRITTGAPMPQGADTVVIKENVVVQDDVVSVPAGVRIGAHVGRAGEDVGIGELVLQRGSVLSPARASLLAALGVAEVEVAKRPTVAVFTTGDELVEPGLPLLPGQIYNSNRELMMGLLRAEGLEPVAWPTLPDDPARMEVMLRDAASAFDVVLTCGGVSAGEKDLVPGFLESQGEVHFWKVRMKPGMPVIFGGLDKALFVGLPGNPVAVLATFLALVRPLLDGLQGRVETRPRRFARLSTAWEKSHERFEFLRGSLQYRPDGVVQVSPNPADASHRLRAASESDSLILLGEGARAYAKGDVVEVLAY